MSTEPAVVDGAEPLFYIWDSRPSSVVGNCASWWRPDGNGYACDLKEAGLFPASKAASLRPTDVMVPQAAAMAMASLHVRVDSRFSELDALKTKNPRVGR